MTQLGCTQRARALLAALVLVTVLSPRRASAQAGIPYLAEPDRRDAPKKTDEAVAPQQTPAAGTGPAAQPEATTAAAPVEPTSGRPFSYFAELWSRRRAALERRDGREAARLLEVMAQAKAAAGWPDFFVYGDALAYESEKALAAGQAAYGLELAVAAAAMAPHRPAIHGLLARAHWSAGSGVGFTIASFWRGIAVTLSEPPLLRLRLGSLLLAVAAAVLIAALALTAATLYRHGRLLIHDLHHLLPAGATRVQATLLGIALLLAPVSLRLGVAWAVLTWLVLLSPYYERRERAGAAAVLVSLAVFAFALPFVTSHAGYAGSRSQDVYLTVRDAGAQAAAERVRARRNLGPEELYALGLRARWSGDVREARDWLDRAAATLNDEDLLVTAGNVRHLVGDRPGAVAAYEAALRQNPDNVAALFNLSRVFYAMMEHQKAGEAHRRAMELDYERVERLNDEAKRSTGVYLVDGGVPRRLLSLRLDYGRAHWRTVMQIWQAVGGRGRRTFAAAALVAVLVILATASLLRVVRPAKLCPRCGHAACGRCNPEMPDQAQCGPCYHAFIDQENVDPQQCIRKEIQAHRYRARQTRARQVLSVLLAGAGQMLRGAFLRGLVLMSAFLSLGVVMLWGSGALPELVPSDDAPRWTSAVLAGAGMLAVYVLSLLDGVREEL